MRKRGGRTLATFHTQYMFNEALVVLLSHPRVFAADLTVVWVGIGLGAPLLMLLTTAVVLATVWCVLR